MNTPTIPKGFTLQEVLMRGYGSGGDYYMVIADAPDTKFIGYWDGSSVTWNHWEILIKSKN